METVLYNFLKTFSDMAPYLLIGFLFAGILSKVLPKSWVIRHLTGRGYKPIFKSALIGVPLPLCSCGVIPVMTSLRKQGANVSAMLSFILSTPQTGFDSILATYALLGLPMAIYRPFIAFVTGIFGGALYMWFVRKDLELKKDGEKTNVDSNEASQGEKYVSNITRTRLLETIKDMLSYGFLTLPREIAQPLLVGLIIASLITAYVPPGFISNYLGNGVLQILLGILIGIPIYVCATASIPIALGLIHLGATPGSALAFLIAGPATNIATIAVVMRFLGKKAVLIYVLTMVLSAFVFGMSFDLLSNRYDLFSFVSTTTSMHMHEGDFSALKIASSIVLCLVLLPALVNVTKIKSVWGSMGLRNRKHRLSYLKLRVDNVSCDHCMEKVKNLVRRIADVKEVEVKYPGGIVTIYGNPRAELIKETLHKAGFTYEIIEDHTACCCHS